MAKAEQELLKQILNELKKIREAMENKEDDRDIDEGEDLCGGEPDDPDEDDDRDDRDDRDDKDQGETDKETE